MLFDDELVPLSAHLILNDRLKVRLLCFPAGGTITWVLFFLPKLPLVTSVWMAFHRLYLLYKRCDCASVVVFCATRVTTPCLCYSLCHHQDGGLFPFLPSGIPWDTSSTMGEDDGGGRGTAVTQATLPCLLQGLQDLPRWCGCGHLRGCWSAVPGSTAAINQLLVALDAGLVGSFESCV